ncbi:Transposase OS=Streptomyces griseorubiginosus OX=67304 GN=AQJ54_39495 PE=4 SV=1 [Streptomyces griseorubiginosus]
MAGVVGRPRRGPDILFADRGHDDKYRRLLRRRGIPPATAERGQPHGTSLATFGWLVERTGF